MNTNQNDRTLETFFESYDKLPSDANGASASVRDFLIQELVRRNGVSHEDSTKAVNTILATVGEIEALHRGLHEWEESGKSRELWIQTQARDIAQREGIPIGNVYSEIATQTCQRNEQLLEYLSGEKLGVISPEGLIAEPEVDGNEENWGKVRQDVLEVLRQNAAFSVGVAAQGVVEGIDENENRKTPFSSKTMEQALTTDYLSPEETRAKQIVAGAIYADCLRRMEAATRVLEDLARQRTLEEQQRCREALPAYSAAVACESVNAAKAHVKVATAPEGQRAQAEDRAARYVQQGATAATQFAASQVFGKVFGWIGYGVGVLANMIGSPVPPEMTAFVGRMAGYAVAGASKKIREFSEAVGHRVAEVAKDTVAAVGHTVARGVKKAAEYTRIVTTVVKETAKGLGKKTKEAAKSVGRAIAGFFGFYNTLR
ncbi:MAG: hypothetical protein Q4D38_11620 [Planctomycetia bacterium]|nr:hypothetical protein [Planctomycetia bacterium]